MITYIKGDLFNAPQDRLLVHAVNCQGVWGSGVAKIFARYYPDEGVAYKAICNFGDMSDGNIGPEHTYLGKALVINSVGCLFTSYDYGDRKDSPEEILKNTETAMQDLLIKTTMKLAMPRINSGLFAVPWEDTEKILNKFDVDIWVYEL